MKRRSALRFALLLALPAVLAGGACLAAPASGAAPGPPFQSQESYTKALRIISSAPAYVMITVIDTRSGTSRTYCTGENHLLGALDRGNPAQGPFDADRLEQLKQIALSNTTHVFRFSKAQALDNISPSYAEDDVAYAREALKGYSPAQLLDDFNTPSLSIDADLKGHWVATLHGALEQQFMQRGTGYRASRDATACALIERGLSPFITDRSGELKVNP